MPSSFTSCNKRIQILPICQQTSNTDHPTTSQVLWTPLQGRSGARAHTPTDSSPVHSDEGNVILRALARIEATLEQQNVILNELGQIVRELKNGDEKTQEVKNFLVSTQVCLFQPWKNFMNLTRQLNLTPWFKKLLYCQLVSIGGINIKMAAKLILDTCLTNNMQTKFNWEGSPWMENKN